MQSSLGKFLIFVHVICFIFFQNLVKPVKDDWNNFSNLRDLPLNLNSFNLIVTNTWCCNHEKRMFFLSWLIQWISSEFGSNSFRVYFLFIGALLTHIGYLTYKIMKHYKFNNNVSLLASVIVSWNPISIIIGGSANNLFLILPIIFCIYLFYLVEVKNRTFDIIILFTIFAILFSGESGIGVLLFYLSYKIIVSDKKLDFVYLFITTIVTTTLYNLFISVGPTDSKFKISFSNIQFYVEQLISQERQIWNPNSEIYTRLFTIPESWFQFGLASILFILLFQIMNNENILKFSRQITIKKSIKFLILSIAFISFSLIPNMLGILSGSRPSPELRYHFLIFNIILATLIILIIKVARENLIISIFLMSYILFTFITAGFTRYQQNNLDTEVWTKISETVELEKIQFIVTHNPYANYNMPAYTSFAESDFHADWSISGYFRWNYGTKPYIFKYLECKESICFGTGYYSEDRTQFTYIDDSILFIMTKDFINEKNVTVDNFMVSKNYGDYVDFKNSNPKLS
jgi:hypothetical protein